MEKYSNPKIVQKLANKHNLGSVQISTRKDKKYMIRDSTNKLIHFGQLGYEDYTVHKDKTRLKNFKKRNAKWKNAPKNSPAWLSYHLLWAD